MSTRIRNIITISLLFILLLTAISAVMANLGLFGLDPNSNFAKTTLGAVLVEIVSAVLLVWKSGALKPSCVSAAIRFPQDTKIDEIDFDISDCNYEIRDMLSKVKASGKISVVLGIGGWECRIPAPDDLDESVTLILREKNGKIWEVRPFYPLSRDVNAVARKLPDKREPSL